MDWHDFKVYLMYGVIAGVIMLFLNPVLGVLILIGYPTYGLISTIRKYRLENKVEAKFDDSVSEEIRGITRCHILYRESKLKKRRRKKLISDINHNNYTSQQLTIIDRYKVESSEVDGAPSYYVRFSNGVTDSPYEFEYGSCFVGNIVWIVKTPSETMQAIHVADEWQNLLKPIRL